MKLSKVLADCRSRAATRSSTTAATVGQPVADPEVKVDFDARRFGGRWTTVLDQAGLGVYPFGRQRGWVVAQGAGQSPRQARQL